MTNKITHNGKQYQGNKVYVCIETGRIGMLKCKDGELLLMTNEQGNWHSDGLEVLPTRMLGLVEDAPIELEEGCWYMTHANKPVYWDGQHWNITATGGNSGRYDSNRFTPLYKMERAK